MLNSSSQVSFSTSKVLDRKTLDNVWWLFTFPLQTYVDSPFMFENYGRRHSDTKMTQYLPAK
jgi:hypothetical protein